MGSKDIQIQMAMDPDEEQQMHLLREQYLSPVGMKTFYRELLRSVQEKDMKRFRSLLDDNVGKQPNIVDINHIYPNETDQTCLDIACRQGSAEFVELLLQKGADPNRINACHNRAPIHFATESGHADVLRILLKHHTVRPNLVVGHRTALHIAVKESHDTKERKYFECAALLLDHNASPNIPNNKGITALHLAAKNASREMVDLIVSRSKVPIDLDAYRDLSGRTARDVLQVVFPDVSSQIPARRKSSIDCNDLRYCLITNDRSLFLEKLKDVKDDELDSEGGKLLMIAVEMNFQEAVEELLKRMKRTSGLAEAAGTAVRWGNLKILRLLLESYPDLANGQLLCDACMELGIPGMREIDDSSVRLSCVKLILEHDNVDVHYKDGKGNTALHYAARADCHEAVKLLVNAGSYIGHMNNFDVPPIANVSVDTLSECLDECIRMKKENTNEYTIEFDYKCLIPRDNSDDDINGQGKRTTSGQLRAEMTTLKYIAEDKVLKDVLKHPLLRSFLDLKWHRIRCIFYANVAFYVTFCVLLNAFILTTSYRRSSNGDRNDTNITWQDDELLEQHHSSTTLRILTGIALLLFALREVAQFVSSPLYYVTCHENWLELILIFLSVGVLTEQGPQTAAVTILLSTWELVILLGQLPKWSTDIHMFKRVSVNFIRSLLLYVFLLIAFAFSFFALFSDVNNDDFSDPWHSVFKTIIMLTGEFEAGEIPFPRNPVLSHVIFTLFVFLIVIVLFNLLNGLAVSDTAEILREAELIGLISRVRLLSYIESTAMGTFCSALGFLAKRILLFPVYLKDGKLRVKPYDTLRNYTDTDWYPCIGGSCYHGKINLITVKEVKSILARKASSLRERDVEMRLLAIETKLDAVMRFVSSKNHDDVTRISVS